jgi:hypothetical protein
MKHDDLLPTDRVEIVNLNEQRYTVVLQSTQRTDMSEYAYKAQVETARAMYQYPALFGAAAFVVVLALQIGGLLWLGSIVPDVIQDPYVRAVVLVAVVGGIAGSPLSTRGIVKVLLEQLKAAG